MARPAYTPFAPSAAPPATGPLRGPRPRLPARSAAGGRRGAALLLVIASLAVVTALTVDLAYNTRVSVQLAANARDELRAYYLAKSGVNLSRLILHFQQQLDQPVAGALGQRGPLAGLRLAVRLWEIVPVDASAMAFLGGAGGLPAEDGRAAFGTFQGGFSARVEDEDRKINVRQLDGVRPFAGAQTFRLAELVKDPRWDFLFDREDANRIRMERKEVFAALKDWEDIDESGSAFTGIFDRPFEPSYGDENAVYDRLPDRYKAKNAPFDTLDELYLVAGVSDAFLAAFGDRLTVYPDLSSTINVNTDDPLELFLNAAVMAGGQVQPVMLDPGFLDRLRATLFLARPLPFLAIGPVQFAQVLQSLGVKVAPEYLGGANAGVTAAFGDRSGTFRVRATGNAGDVKRTVEAVVLFDRRALGLERDLGRLIHWSEE